MPAVHAVVFDEKISQGAVGGVSYSTTIIAALGGWEQRIANWDAGRLRWDISKVLKDRATLHYVITFFRARRGKAYGFLFKDWSDYYVGMSWVADVLTHTGTPEEIGTGDGVETEFQLTKTYEDAAGSEVRTVTRPKASGLKIWTKTGSDPWDDVDPADYTLDDTTGIVTFDTAPANGVLVGWSGEFYVPVRFDSDAQEIVLEGYGRGEWNGVNIVELRE